ncbi:MAG: nuclear transport factor 2 family protein [Burkholderiaceae bacterium]|nr:nuclear transport factor 2 family protein [Burkholderiaceae bacterium]
MQRSSPDPVLADHPALAAERRRAAALVARDVDALAALLDDELRYVHAPGACHDKAALLGFVADGPRFESVEFTPQQMWSWPGGVAVAGRLQMRLQRGDEPPVQARSWVTALWREGADGAWRLLMFQSTKEP